jgi:hypothetical protein
MLDLTITQNSALYLAQHRLFKPRASLFGHRRVLVKELRPHLQGPAFSEPYFVSRFFHHNPR